MDAQDDDFDWEGLLFSIAEGRVVPIVGRDLLVLPDPERGEVLLEHELAQRLAGKLRSRESLLALGGLDTRPPSLHDVAFRFIHDHPQDKDKVYSRLSAVYRELAPPVPEPLRQLAEIRPLQLFVSTTFDDLMARALEEVRGGEVKRLCYSPFQSTQTSQDLPSTDLSPDGAPTVYRIFGRVTAAPDYAVTDEDMLEFICKLQAATEELRNLFDVLGERQLLFLGCGFPDWLARFFIRTIKHQRFSVVAERARVADERVLAENNLVVFLQYYRTDVYGAGAVEFVKALHDRWIEAHGASIGTEERRDTGEALRALPPGLGKDVFLSYARDDVDAVRRLRDALAEQGVQCWLDEHAMEPGGDYEQVIEAAIHSCRLFVPLLSRKAVSRDTRFVYLEWKIAQKRAERMAEGVTFIVPAALDTTPMDTPNWPASFRKLHMMRLTDAAAQRTFVSRLRDLVMRRRESEKTQ